MASGRLVDYIGKGTLAARPASLTLTTGAMGLYYATDTGAISVWDGSAWQTPTFIVSDEIIDDRVAALMVAGTGITLTYNDGSNTLTVDTTITQYTDEMARDALGVALTAGTGVTITPNDGSDIITVAVDTTAEAERIRDVIGTALVAGANTTITVNDAGDTITIASSAGGATTLDGLTDVDTTSTPPSNGNVLTYNSGSSLWVPAAPAGSPVLTLISEVVTSASQTTVDFSSIATTWRDLILVVRARGTAASANAMLRLRFNGDSGATNYAYQLSITSNGNSLSGTPDASDPYIHLGYITAATGFASARGVVETTIYDYKNTTHFKNVVADGGLTNDGTVGQIFRSDTYGYWKSTAAINQITALLDAGAFLDGSVVSLYGRM